MSELINIENIRHPLKVTMCGEMCEDLGGPRKEFLNELMKELRDKMIDESNQTLVQNREYIAQKYYYAAGIAVGEITYVAWRHLYLVVRLSY